MPHLDTIWIQSSRGANIGTQYTAHMHNQAENVAPCFSIRYEEDRNITIIHFIRYDKNNLIKFQEVLLMLFLKCLLS